MAHLINPRPLLFDPGDRLSREEFLERWDRMPELKNAELIDGVVYMPSPVSLTHGTLDTQFLFVLSYYAAFTPGCECVSNTTWLMLESAPQPDAALYILPQYGGRTTERDDFAVGAPELATEVVYSDRGSSQASGSTRPHSGVETRTRFLRCSRRVSPRKSMRGLLKHSSDNETRNNRPGGLFYFSPRTTSSGIFKL